MLPATHGATPPPAADPLALFVLGTDRPRPGAPTSSASRDANRSKPAPQRQTRPPSSAPVALHGTAHHHEGRVPHALLRSMPSCRGITFPPIIRFRVRIILVFAHGLSTTQKAVATAAERDPSSTGRLRRRRVSHRFGSKHTPSEPAWCARDVQGSAALPVHGAPPKPVLRTRSRRLRRARVVSGRLRPVDHSKLASVGRHRLGSRPEMPPEGDLASLER
jgi:hypothetical protein